MGRRNWEERGKWGGWEDCDAFRLEVMDGLQRTCRNPKRSRFFHDGQCRIKLLYSDRDGSSLPVTPTPILLRRTMKDNDLTTKRLVHLDAHMLPKSTGEAHRGVILEYGAILL